MAEIFFPRRRADRRKPLNPGNRPQPMSLPEAFGWQLKVIFKGLCLTAGRRPKGGYVGPMFASLGPISALAWPMLAVGGPRSALC